MGEHRGADSAAVVDEAEGRIRCGAASEHTGQHPQEDALRVEAHTARFKKRDEPRFRKAQREITDMLAAVDRGEIALGYCDEAGFALAYPNHSAWTPVGQCHRCDAVRGKRLNVVGALMSSGELFSVKLWKTMTALLFAGFLGLLMQYVGRPLVLVLDNASVHTSEEIQPLLKVLERQGLTLYFQTPYGPELNRIEKLLHKIKYEWMAFTARSAKAIEADVDEILAGFGKRHEMDFC